MELRNFKEPARGRFALKYRSSTRYLGGAENGLELAFVEIYINFRLYPYRTTYRSPEISKNLRVVDSHIKVSLFHTMPERAENGLEPVVVEINTSHLPYPPFVPATCHGRVEAEAPARSIGGEFLEHTCGIFVSKRVSYTPVTLVKLLTFFTAEQRKGRTYIFILKPPFSFYLEGVLQVEVEGEQRGGVVPIEKNARILL